MIRGLHAMFYTSEPEALRAFFRDRLGFPCYDAGQGWLIFDLPQADLGCHPEDPDKGALSGTPHLSFYCDDIQATMAQLRSRGVEFTSEPVNQGYGLVTHFKAPGSFTIQLYQPLYAKGGAEEQAQAVG